MIEQRMFSFTIFTLFLKFSDGAYFLSLYHWIVGKGVPCTLHSRVMSCLRIAETS